MAKKAVLIGCNYPGTKAELKGCINDVKRMQKCLIDRYAFSPNDIAVLIDTHDSRSQPTGKNIRTAVSHLVRSAHPGDFLFVHYSGHGTRLPSQTGDADDTGYDECIVPSDMNLITDDDFREFVDQIPKGCRMTIVSDSCHSGGLVDESKEQIGQSTKKRGDDDSSSGSGLKSVLHQTVQGAFESRGIHIPSGLMRPHHQEDDVEEKFPTTKSRSLPISTLIEILKQKTGKDDIDVGTIRPSLFNIFGEDASPKVQKFMSIILNKFQHETNNGGNGGVLGMVGNLGHEFLKQKLDENNNGVPAGIHGGGLKRELPDGGILISGCQTDQTSADASPVGGTPYGAFSNAIQEVLEEVHGGITNQEVVMKARAKLKSQGFKQQPGLYCNDHHVDVAFVC